MLVNELQISADHNTAPSNSHFVYQRRGPEGAEGEEHDLSNYHGKSMPHTSTGNQPRMDHRGLVQGLGRQSSSAVRMPNIVPSGINPRHVDDTSTHVARPERTLGRDQSYDGQRQRIANVKESCPLSSSTHDHSRLPLGGSPGQQVSTHIEWRGSEEDSSSIEMSESTWTDIREPSLIGDDNLVCSQHAYYLFIISSLCV